MAKQYAKCERCDLAFSFKDFAVGPRCGTKIIENRKFVERKFGIGNKEYSVKYYYEKDGFPEDYAGYMLNQGMVLMMGIPDNTVTIDEIEK